MPLYMGRGYIGTTVLEGINLFFSTWCSVHSVGDYIVFVVGVSRTALYQSVLINCSVAAFAPPTTVCPV